MWLRSIKGFLGENQMSLHRKGWSKAKMLLYRAKIECSSGSVCNVRWPKHFIEELIALVISNVRLPRYS